MRTAILSPQMLYGSAVSIADLNDSALSALIAKQCAIVATSGPLYWRRVQPEPGHFDFGNADRIVAFAEKHGIAVRGHTLVWHELAPPWLRAAVQPHLARAVLTEHVSTVVSRFRGRVHSWDVVNEPLEPGDCRSDGLRNTDWLRTLGPAYIAAALHAARDADASALLGVNEYGLESDSPSAAARRDAMYSLIANLRRSGAPLDYLGLQAHLVGRQTYSNSGLGAFIERVRDLGVRVMITEMDVSDAVFSADLQSRDAAVASVYDDFLGVALRSGHIDAVLTWGLSDRSSWLQVRSPRSDGAPQRPLPFDSELQPKPAWRVIESRLRATNSGGRG